MSDQPLADQDGKRPTNKLMTASAGFVLSSPIIGAAVLEVWPQIAPAWASGPSMTMLVASAACAAFGFAAAYFVPDRNNIPR